MKTSEKVLLAATIGLGVILAAACLPGRGRTGRSSAHEGGSLPAQPAAAKADAVPPTLELLATGGVELAPVPEKLRNPFRPILTMKTRPGVPVELRVTGIFGEEGNRAALLSGERLEPGVPGGDGPVIQIEADVTRVDAYLKGARVHLSSNDARLVSILRGKLVRVGDTLGGLTIEQVSLWGVRLRFEGEELFVRFMKRVGDQDPSAGAAPDDESDMAGPAEH